MKGNKYFSCIKSIFSSIFRVTTSLNCKYNKAFTLAEVLVTLMIIGVVASFTIPSLTQSYKERETVSKLKTTYSLLSQSLQLAKLEYGEPDTWYSSSSETTHLKKYEDAMSKVLKNLHKNQDCGIETKGCFASQSYKLLNGDPYVYIDIFENNYNFYKAVLSNGAGIAIQLETLKCTSNNRCGLIFIDTNGQKGPNQLGYDFFIFFYGNNGIIPNKIDDCNGKSNRGLGCSNYILEKGNMNYLHKDN